MRLDDIPCESLKACHLAPYLRRREQDALAPRTLEHLASLIGEIDLIAGDSLDDDDWLVW